MVTGKFDNPAIKLQIQDISSITIEDGTWVYHDSMYKFKINLLWLQGTISSISPDMDQIHLKHEDKTVIVENCKKIPGGNDWIELGQYIMVFGEIRATQLTSLNVRAIKISNLSHNPVFEQMWPYDVEEAKSIYSELGQ